MLSYCIIFERKSQRVILGACIFEGKETDIVPVRAYSVIEEANASCYYKERYDNMYIQEYKLEQAAKKYHTELQRLAGKTAVDKLELYQYDFNAALFKGQEE